MLYICLVESQIVSSVKEEETLPEYGDHISSEDKVLFENGEEDNGEKLELTSVPSEGNYSTIIFNDTL